MAAFVVLPCRPSASAHAVLESSMPGANSVARGEPAGRSCSTSTTTSRRSLASIELFDGDRRPVEIGAPGEGDDGSVVAASLPPLDDGIYAVVWRVTSADGHVVEGAFSFQIGTAAAGDGQDLIDQVSDGVGVDTSLSWAYGVARFLALIGALLLVGVGGWSLQGRPSHRHAAGGTAPAVGRVGHAHGRCRGSIRAVRRAGRRRHGRRRTLALRVG